MAIEKKHIEKLKELKQFLLQNGHCYVPNTKDNQDLYGWTIIIKQSRPRLSKELVTELEGLNFDWEMHGSKDMKWLSAYYELKNYKAQHGHCKVPKVYKENTYLGAWVSIQRRYEQKLPTYRKKLLDEIGFLWKKDIERLKEQDWDNRFKDLKKFKKKYGHCRVTAHKSSHRLAAWVQRIRHNKVKVSPQKIERLDAIGFMWAEDMIRFKEECWQQRYQELCLFQKAHGHCRVGGQRGKYPELKSWVTIQRKNYEKLPTDKKELLNKIGLETSADIRIKHQQSWLEKYTQLKQFHKKHGHCKVPSKFKENPSLGIWVRNQFKRPYQLNTEQKKLLNDLNFHWEGIKRTKQKWQERMDRLKQFKKEYGHCKVPQRWEKDRELARWVRYLREHQKTRLPTYLVKQLDTIDFKWQEDRKQEREKKWLKNYQQLVAFKKQHGHLKLSSKDKLYQWAANQRNQRYNLSENRRRLLDDINFEWELKPMPNQIRSNEHLKKNWFKNYESLVTFKKENGHANVKYNKENPKLGLWVFNQKKKFYNKMLPNEYTVLLNQLGMEWDYQPRV